jgi:hypothetical protein
MVKQDAHVVCFFLSFFLQELRGFFVGCGLNSAGIMYSGGFGRALADWVVTGAPKIDIFSADVTRFHPDCTGKNTAVWSICSAERIV